MRVLALALTLILGDAAAAQVDIERMRRRLPGDGVVVAVDAGGSLSTGNSDLAVVGLGGRADVQRGIHLAFVVGRFDLTRADGETIVDQQFAHVRYNRDLPGWLVAEVFSQVERNPQQRLERRALAGAGFRAEFLDRDSLGLAVGTTPMLEVERLDPDLGVDPTPRVRLSTYLTGRIVLDSGASLTGTTYIQPRADDLADYRILSNASLSVPITRFVRLRLSSRFRYDQEPPPDVDKADLRLETGLVLVFPAR